MNHTHGHSSPRRDAEAEANPCASAGNPLLGTPDFDALRTRAHNLRWATVAADVIPLTAADPDLPVASPIIDAITAYVRTPHLSYGPAAGIPEFGAAVARHFKTTKDATVASARVIATNSAASGITLVARHLLKSGDEVVVQDPVDFLVAESARRAGATLRFWRADAGRWTAEGLRAAITPATRAVFVCSPHNPVGALWTPAEVSAIAAVASEYQLTLVSDEVWSDVVLDGRPFRSFAAHAQEACRAWVVYGLSKGFGLAGLRIGAVIAPTATDAEQFQEAQGFRHTIEGVSTVSQIAAIAALEQCGPWLQAFLAHCAAQRDFARRRLCALPGVELACAPMGTFVLFFKISGTGLSEEVLAERIETYARVRVVPGSPRWFGAGAAGHIRLSLATTRAVLDDALTRIEAAWPTIVALGDRRPASTGSEAEIDDV